ncbi:Hypothetical_protein [Hexamita inflata]|uniref:Hypothetical_protein n=1 Tax=Hexamita inflata TaxID=28002 RepID=A0AA86NN86_9EUKA|nr:Hypothetical protein HINF_LOCUS10765 [Hexamita inflata]
MRETQARCASRQLNAGAVFFEGRQNELAANSEAVFRHSPKQFRPNLVMTASRKKRPRTNPYSSVKSCNSSQKLPKPNSCEPAAVLRPGLLQLQRVRLRLVQLLRMLSDVFFYS